MLVKDIVNLLPTGHSFRFEINGLWSEWFFKDDCAYNRVMQDYGNYNVIQIEAYDNGIYDYATLWLKVEKTEDKE